MSLIQEEKLREEFYREFSKNPPYLIPQSYLDDIGYWWLKELHKVLKEVEGEVEKLDFWWNEKDTPELMKQKVLQILSHYTNPILSETELDPTTKKEGEEIRKEIESYTNNKDK